MGFFCRTIRVVSSYPFYSLFNYSETVVYKGSLITISLYRLVVLSLMNSICNNVICVVVI